MNTAALRRFTAPARKHNEHGAGAITSASVRSLIDCAPKGFPNQAQHFDGCGQAGGCRWLM